MNLRQLVEKNRSYRRYYQDREVGYDTLKHLVNLARLSASARNAQPLKYVLCCDPRKNALVFETLGWAGYLKEWPGPPEGERPSAYIAVLGDKKISNSFGCDHGIAAQSILLGAVEAGLGGCIIATIERDVLEKVLGTGPQLEILLVIALGVPKEEVVIEHLAEGKDIKYWRDAEGTHHVPKRSLDEIILK